MKKRIKEVVGIVETILLGANIVIALRDIYQILIMQIIAINTKGYPNQRKNRLRIDQESRSSMDSEVRIEKIQ